MSNNKLDIFNNFFRSNQHLLEQGDNNWPKERILFQLAYEHAKDSPISMQADSFFISSKVDWKWLRLLNKPRKIKYQPESFSLYFREAIEGIDYFPDIYDSYDELVDLENSNPSVRGNRIVKLLIIQETIITVCTENILRITLFKKRAEYIQIEKTRFFNNIHSKGGNLKSIKLITINENQFISYCSKEFIFWKLDSSDYMVINNSYDVYGFNIITSEDNLTTDFAFSIGDSDCLLWSISNKQYQYLKGEKFLADNYPFFITISSKEIVLRNLEDKSVQRITCDHNNYDVKILNNYLVLLGLDKSIIVRDIRSGSILFDNHLTKTNQSANLERSLWVNDVQLLQDNYILYCKGFWKLTSPSGKSKRKVITDTFILDLNNIMNFRIPASEILFKVHDYLFYIEDEALSFYSISDKTCYRTETISCEIFEDDSINLIIRVICCDMFLICYDNIISIYQIKELNIVLLDRFELESKIDRLVKEYNNDYIDNCFVILTENGDVHILNEDLRINKYVGHTAMVTEYQFLSKKLFTKSTDGSFRSFNLRTKESLSFPGHIANNSHLVWINEKELLSYNNYTIRYTNLRTSETAVLSGSSGLVSGVLSLSNSKVFKDIAIAWDTTGFLRFWDLRKIKRNKIVKGNILPLDNHESAITYVEKINSNELLSFSRDGTIRILDVPNNISTQIFPLLGSNREMPPITNYKIEDNLLYFVSNKTNDLSVINLNDYSCNSYSIKNINGRVGIRNITLFSDKIVYNTFSRSASNLSIFNLNTNRYISLECEGILYQGIKKISKSKFVSYTNFADAKNEIGYLTLWDVNYPDPIVNICVDEFRTTKEERKKLNYLGNRKRAELTGIYRVTSKIIATYHRNGYIIFWDLKQGIYETKQLHKGNIVGVHFINKKDYYSWSTDGTLKITKDSSTTLLEEFNSSLERGVGNSIQVKFERSKIIVFSANGMISILNRFNHTREFYIEAHNDYIYDVLIYYNKVISVSRDNTIKVWNYKTKELISCYATSGVRKVYVIKNRLIAYSNDGDIKVLRMI